MILTPRMQDRLDAAAGPTLESIRADREQAPEELKPIFSYIEAHLFDYDFSVEKMKRECGIRDNSVSTRFRRATGMRPSDYIREQRLRVARELLKQPEPDVSVVAEMLGFNSSQVMSRNFRKRFEVSPREHRDAHRGAAAETADPDFSVIEVRRGLEGLLEPERGQALIQELTALYPPSGEQNEPAAPDFDLAMAIWERIRRLPPEDELPAMREQLAIACRELFELLCDRSRVEGRRSRRRGVRLAERALECLEICASVLGDELSGLKALGWARLGNAQRLALDFTAAEEAFRRSERDWCLPGRRLRPLVKAEILSRKAAFRAAQDRFTEAKELADQGLELLEDDEESGVLAKTLILRASITGAEGELEASIADLKRARELVDPADGRLRLSVCHNLAAAYVDAGRFAEASEILPLAQDLCSAHGDSLEQFQLRWVEGRVAKGLGKSSLAEERFHASRAGFLAAGETAHAAVVAIELALIYCQQGRPEAVRYAAEAIPLLDAYKFRSEALAARRLLAQTEERKRVTPEVLRRVRAVLIRLVSAPAVRLPSGR